MESTTGTGKYTVVARRYRPKTFSELVGQATVAHALLNAIHTNRVGHAYLFTGARGVGKTSTARIFAKALNASASSDGSFDPNSDIALAIDTGEDMDVIEIDGASNRGIDEIRQLRANASVRPSRSPYKIYIIDEVHMLTTAAFNALLKTLEEPPGHVKFIFCTTDPEKIPITVLSRCQRFDFPPVHTDQILGRLKFICENEGKQADDAALQLVARRAAGSMRDSQSLLEQLLSFSGDRIRVEDVHSMLGTADETRLASFAQKLIQRDAAGALRELHDAAVEGVDVGQLAEQLLGYLRDMMTVTVGAPDDLIRTANPNSAAQLKTWGSQWGTMTLISALQILDETIVKMRHSVQSRILMEIALVQVCQLQDLQSLTDLLKAFASGQSAPPPRLVSVAPSANEDVVAKKKDELVDLPSSTASTALQTIETLRMSVDSTLTEAGNGQASDESTVVVNCSPDILPPQDEQLEDHEHAKLRHDAGERLGEPDGQNSLPASLPAEEGVSEPPIGDSCSQMESDQTPVEPLVESVSALSELDILKKSAEKLGGLIIQCIAMIVRVERLSANKWKALIAKDGQFAIDYFQTGDNARRLANAIVDVYGNEILIEFGLTNESAPESAALPVSAPPVETFRPSANQAQLIRNAMTNSLVKLIVEKFEGQIVRVDQPTMAKPHVQVASALEESEVS